MAEFEDKIAQLQARLENLVKTQISFQQEITQIRNELNFLRGNRQPQNTTEPPGKPPVREYVPPPGIEQPPINQQTNQQTKPPNFGYSDGSKKSFEPAENHFQPKQKSEIEKFIGENLISKIGIVVLVIGVAIGAKYAIDNNLISPLTRIVLGYLFGFGLLGLALQLKAKYLNFSSVLLSGSIAIMYFITYFAYGLYGLLPQSAAFALMMGLTAFTVIAAINYSRQFIAHLGLVGAYAVPFLLSDDSGNYAFLFTYIAIINIGILAISLRTYWKPLFYTSFFFTWVIYGGWYLTSFNPAEHINLAFLFLTVFFLIFYLTFVAYKVVSDKNLAVENVFLILTNSFIFYGIGYSILVDRRGFEDYIGLFTLGNAAIHFAFASTISRLKLFPNDLVYLLAGLVITFATISIPVQLDGNWVTLIWTVEATMLFWIGRTKQISLFQYFSFPLMFFALVSLLQGWFVISQSRGYDQLVPDQFPMLNGNFLTSMLFAIVFGSIFYINKDERFETAFDEALRKPFGWIIAAVGLGVFYNCFRIEIANYFHYLTVKTAFPNAVSYYGDKYTQYDSDLEFFNVVWQINYTMLFLSVLSFINIKRFKNVILAYSNLFLDAFVLFVFVTFGLYFLSELRESYLQLNDSLFFIHGLFHIIIRYVSYAFCAVLLFAFYRYTKQKFLLETASQHTLNLVFDFVFHITLLIVLSSELLNLTDIFGYQNSNKLGFSILWGIYALGLIILGIYKNKKHLRIGAIVLFAMTLAKLFFYDIADLDTISKTIVFVSLGILMLIVSFLYNKAKYQTRET